MSHEPIVPTQVVAPVTVETFNPYAKLGKSNGKIQARTCDLLFKLVQPDDPAKIKSLCELDIGWLEKYNADYGYYQN